MILNFDFDLPYKLHLDDVLEVLLVVGIEFLIKLLYKYQRNIHFKKKIIDVKGQRYKLRSQGPPKKTFKRFQSNLPKTMFYRSCGLIFNFFALFSTLYSLNFFGRTSPKYVLEVLLVVRFKFLFLQNL